jgi:hypothetical protein
MLALNDRRLQIVMTAAGPLAPEKRVVLLARLKLQGLRRPTDVDIECALDQCLRGLVQEPAA